MPDRLDQHARHHAFRRPLHQLEREATADTVAHEKELLDPEMVHQPQLIVGECVPWVSGGDWAAGLAAVRVALIHRDATELVLEYLHRVENRIGPVAYARVQGSAQNVGGWGRGRYDWPIDCWLGDCGWRGSCAWLKRRATGRHGSSTSWTSRRSVLSATC